MKFLVPEIIRWKRNNRSTDILRDRQSPLEYGNHRAHKNFIREDVIVLVGFHDCGMPFRSFFGRNTATNVLPSRGTCVLLFCARITLVFSHCKVNLFLSFGLLDIFHLNHIYAFAVHKF